MKILLWIISNDGTFLNGATTILERQHGGIEIIGMTANENVPLFRDGKQVNFIPLEQVDGGGGIRYFARRRRRTNRHE